MSMPWCQSNTESNLSSLFHGLPTVSEIRIRYAVLPTFPTSASTRGSPMGWRSSDVQPYKHSHSTSDLFFCLFFSYTRCHVSHHDHSWLGWLSTLLGPSYLTRGPGFFYNRPSLPLQSLVVPFILVLLQLTISHSTHRSLVTNRITRVSIELFATLLTRLQAKSVSS